MRKLARVTRSRLACRVEQVDEIGHVVSRHPPIVANAEANLHYRRVSSETLRVSGAMLLRRRIALLHIARIQQGTAERFDMNLTDRDERFVLPRS